MFFVEKIKKISLNCPLYPLLAWSSRMAKYFFFSFSKFLYTELEIRASTEDNSKIIFLISQQKRML